MTDEHEVVEVASADATTKINIGKAQITLGQLAQIVIYVVMLVMAYSALDKRIAALEIKYDRIASDVSEIKADVKLLLERKS